MKCECTDLVKNGTKRYRTGKHQMYQCRGCGASKKGEVLEPLPKGNDMEIRAGPEKKPDLKKFMKKM